MEENIKNHTELKNVQQFIQITPKTKYLSAGELTALRNNEIPTVSAGLKRTQNENTDEEKNELERLYANLQNQLSRPRIERLAGRAEGVWDSDKNLVRVKRKDGKFGQFGFSIEGELYLEYYEALFLLEVNRLQLEYNSTIMSIEQAYLLLMGEQHSPKFQEYLVYSNLTRVGYILVKHQNKHFQQHKINSETDCVWAILEAELQDETVADYVKKTPFYAKVKQKFDNINGKIKNQTQPEEMQLQNESDLIFSKNIRTNLKRKAPEDKQNEWLAAKRHCNYAFKVFQRSLVDFLKDEDDYKQFKEIFERFDLVPLKLNEMRKSKEMENAAESESESESGEEIEESDTEESKYQINFDVYLHNEGFRKSSPHLPKFRVIILQTDQRFPKHDEIYLAYRQQLNPVPLLIVSVNDSKQMQAFLYYFS